MDEYRICAERYKEHLSSIRDSDYNDDKKCAFMCDKVVLEYGYLFHTSSRISL